MVDMTYVALKPLRIGGQRREPGELVPEAATWPRVSAWIDTGRITAVAKSSVDPEALKAAEDAFAARIKAKQEADESAKGETEVESEAVVEPNPAYQSNAVPEDEEAPADGEGEEESEDESEDEDHEVETFATGTGWYEIPGADKKMRRDEAIEYLAGLEDDEE